LRHGRLIWGATCSPCGHARVGSGVGIGFLAVVLAAFGVLVASRSRAGSAARAALTVLRLTRQGRLRGCSGISNLQCIWNYKRLGQRLDHRAGKIENATPRIRARLGARCRSDGSLSALDRTGAAPTPLDAGPRCVPAIARGVVDRGSPRARAFRHAERVRPSIAPACVLTCHPAGGGAGRLASGPWRGWTARHAAQWLLASAVAYSGCARLYVRWSALRRCLSTRRVGARVRRAHQLRRREPTARRVPGAGVVPGRGGARAAAEAFITSR